MMMSPALHYPPWSDQHHHYQYNPHMDLRMNTPDFCSSFTTTTTEDLSDASSLLPTIPTNRTPSNIDQTFCETMVDDVGMSIKDMEDILRLFDFDGDQQPSQEGNQGIIAHVPAMEYSCGQSPPTSSSTSQSLPSFTPSEQSHGDNNVQVALFHLFKAFGDAVQGGYPDLASVVLRRIGELADPAGTTMERLAHHLVHGSAIHGETLKQESRRNYAAAFRAFYELCPIGRFAHFVANAAILESIPADAEVVHIVDYDAGEGVQWAPILAAIGQGRPVRLTFINHVEDGSPTSDVGTSSRFDKTKKWLLGYGRSMGMTMRVDEMSLEELVLEKRMTVEAQRPSAHGGREWLVMNCMTCLPHMGEAASGRKEAMEFIKVATELIGGGARHGRRGIITVGDGYEVVMRNCSGFGEFFAGCLSHSHALLKSLEWHFPDHLSLARTAIECLFVGHCISSSRCLRDWEERRGGGLGGFPVATGVERSRFSQQNLVAAKEMAREGESPYTVRVTGEWESEMVLEWMGLPLVRVSAWW